MDRDVATKLYFELLGVQTELLEIARKAAETYLTDQEMADSKSAFIKLHEQQKMLIDKLINIGLTGTHIANSAEKEENPKT